jgi:ATP-dependent Lhr-like helicase
MSADSKTHYECLSSFDPLIRDWFIENVGLPSEPQRKGWPEIAAGRNALICAPTGSGKTFAAFLKCLDWLMSKKNNDTGSGVKIVYISPLKALNNDIYRNLELPISGLRKTAEEKGYELPEIKVAVRTGDTSQKDRARMIKDPPDILITTPESLYIILTSNYARKMFSTVEYLIVDEIHSICANKRGVHLAITMERLERVAGKPLKRIGLTATINPLEEAAGFLSGGRSIKIINCDKKRSFDLSVMLPVKDLKVLPENTVWPAIYAELMTLVKAHRSTLIFVNNRRVAEMVASGLNMLADEPFVKTHHGSVSKEIRAELERQLKEGELTCLVATSSLELGIDIGSIDLVVQVSAPGSVSQVLQRIGRSGHRLDAKSTGVIIPKTRGDLLDSTFISYQAKQYEIENIKVPQNCLDILAQQIISISCEGEQQKTKVYGMIRRSYPYRDLPEKQFEDVLLMLSDPSPPDAPGSVKPRIYYDRGTGLIRSTPTGKRMCLMNGGTIPDKGNYHVYLAGTNVKVGELQEEFVFESRIGDRFFLGSSVWRVEKIEKDRVLVTPSSASGGKIPFWIGDKTYRTYETGKKLGQFLAKLEKEHDSEGFYDLMSKECGLDRTAAENLRVYIADQLYETRHLPSDHRIICEHFSDETGDRRILIHSPFGGRVHAPLAVILNAKLSRLLNCRIEYFYNDSGILFHILGYTGKLSNIFSLLDRESLEDEIFELLPEDPLFNINLRYNLTRSLLVDMQGFGKRTPLWIQRLRCAETAARVLTQPDHPTVVETYRECMNDIFDIKSLYEVIEQIGAGKILVTDVYTEKPSPFSSELIFNFWMIYQYLYELPVAERRNQLLVNDRDFIQLAAGANAEYELLDPRAIEAVVKELDKYKYDRKIISTDDLYYFLYSFGELKASPYSVSVFNEGDNDDVSLYIEQLEKQRRIIRTRINDSNDLYWVAAEDFPLYYIVSGKDAENTALIIGKPGLETTDKAVNLLNSYVFALAPCARDAAVRLIRRYVMFTGPFCIKDISERYAMNAEVIKEALNVLVSGGEVLKLKEMESSDESIYCHRRVYERIKHKTVLLARSDMKPKPPEVYCSYLFSRYLLTDKVLSPEEKLPEVLKMLHGQYYPVSWWEDFILPSRIEGYDPRMLDYLCAAGVVKWRGRLNKTTQEAAFFVCGDDEEQQYDTAMQRNTAQQYNVIQQYDAAKQNSTVQQLNTAFCQAGTDDSEFTMDETEEKILAVLDAGGAVFLKDLSKKMALAPSDLLAKLERLLWCGVVSNDSFAVARYYIDNEKKNSPWTKYNTYPNMGRWYRTYSAEENNVNMSEDIQTGWIEENRTGKLENIRTDITENNKVDIARHIDYLLDRYGIICKEIASLEKGSYTWTEIYTWLKNNEFTSGIKRGFYVSGLSAIQFARDKDIELIRMMESSYEKDEYITLCSCDPANPYKDILSGASACKVPKQQGSAIVFCSGRPVLAVREYGNVIQPMTDDNDILRNAIAAFTDAYSSRRIWTGRKNIYTEYWRDLSGDSECSIEDSPLYDALLECGFDRGYKGITLWRKAL